MFNFKCGFLKIYGVLEVNCLILYVIQIICLNTKNYTIFFFENIIYSNQSVRLSVGIFLLTML
jgi:hypothetical protein